MSGTGHSVLIPEGRSHSRTVLVNSSEDALVYFIFGKGTTSDSHVPLVAVSMGLNTHVNPAREGILWSKSFTAAGLGQYTVAREEFLFEIGPSMTEFSVCNEALEIRVEGVPMTTIIDPLFKEANVITVFIPDSSTTFATPLVVEIGQCPQLPDNTPPKTFAVPVWAIILLVGIAALVLSAGAYAAFVMYRQKNLVG